MMGLIIHKEGENKSSSPSGGNRGAARVEAIMQNLSKYCYQSACCLNGHECKRDGLHVDGLGYSADDAGKIYFNSNLDHY